MRLRRSVSSVLSVGLMAGLTLVAGATPGAARPAPAKHPVAQGYFGAVVSDTPESTAGRHRRAAPRRHGRRRRGRGGRDARRHRSVRRRHRRRRLLRLLRRPHPPGVHNRRSRDHARPPTARPCSSTRRPASRYAFPTAVTSGLSVGVPGQRWPPGSGRCSAGAGSAWPTTCGPPSEVADRGFAVDATFRELIRENAARFAQFSLDGALFLPGGAAARGRLHHAQPGPRRHLPRDRPARHRRAVRRLDRRATSSNAVQHLPLAPGATLDADPRADAAVGPAARTGRWTPAPTHVNYRGYDVYGMAPSSSGGITVGEALNILQNFDLSTMDRGAGAAPLPGGDAAGVRRPRPLHRRPALRRTCRSSSCCRRSSPASAPA